MNRARVSTTLDAARLDRARTLSGLSDSKLLDRALAVLIDDLERERELAALDRHPYDDDPELSSWQAAPAPLPYDGDVPDAVIRLAEQRRVERAG